MGPPSGFPKDDTLDASGDAARLRNQEAGTFTQKKPSSECDLTCTPKACEKHGLLCSR